MLLSNVHFESLPLLHQKYHKDHLKLWTLDKCSDQRAFPGWFADIPASHASDRHLIYFGKFDSWRCALSKGVFHDGWWHKPMDAFHKWQWQGVCANLWNRSLTSQLKLMRRNVQVLSKFRSWSVVHIKTIPTRNVRCETVECCWEPLSCEKYSKI